MKRQEIIFYGICLLFGAFNPFNGTASVLYCITGLTIAIVISTIFKHETKLKK